MKFIYTTLLSLGISLAASATPAIKSCVGTTKTHILSLEQMGPDVHVSLENSSLQKYRDIEYPKEGKLKISGKETSLIVVSNQEIEPLMKTRYLSRELVVALILGRPEFRGEEDLIYSYADEFIHALVCK